jgi:nitroimidazol reductase NimA-like FMN-containing flavoprotein (pyridoxamine 5'-phosphate oxidase superfamily)
VQTLSKMSAEHFLVRNTIGRLGCYSPEEKRVYVVPISYRFRGQTAYFGCLPGRKLDYLRAHPAGVCLEVDQVNDEQDWVSVVATGQFQELSGYEYVIEQPAAVARAGHGPLRWTFLTDGNVRGHELILCGLRIQEITGRRDSWWAAPELLEPMNVS